MVRFGLVWFRGWWDGDGVGGDGKDGQEDGNGGL